METKKETQFVVSRRRSVQRLVSYSIKEPLSGQLCFSHKVVRPPTGNRDACRSWATPRACEDLEGSPIPCLRFELRKRDRDSGKGGVRRPLAGARQRARGACHLRAPGPPSPVAHLLPIFVQKARFGALREAFAVRAFAQHGADVIQSWKSSIRSWCGGEGGIYPSERRIDR